MKVNLLKVLGVGLVATSLTACGPQLSDPAAGTAESNQDSNTPGDGEFVTIGVTVSEAAGIGFALASASDFDMSLEGCASGLTYTGINATTPNIDMYKFDRDCVVKLNSFQYGGNTYEPSAGDPFASWAQGDIATFENTLDANDTLKVIVSSQVSNPLDAADTVAYAFSEIVAGADQTIAKNVVSDNNPVSVEGVPAPAFTVSAVSFAGVTATGAGQFVFSLNCDAALGGTDPDETCEGLNLQDIDYKLVADTYGGTLTEGDLSTIFASGTTDVLEADELAIGDANAANGGFATATLDGPAEMHNNPNMILILEASDTSYIYYNIDVETLTY